MDANRAFAVDDMPSGKRAARSFACDCAERLMCYFSHEGPKDPARDIANAARMIGGRDALYSARDVANETMRWATDKGVEMGWMVMRLYEYHSGII